MFKKVLQSLSKSLNRQHTGPLPTTRPDTASREVIGASSAPPSSPPSAAASQKVAAPAPAAHQTPEDLCGITAKMNKEQIRDQLKTLYRRFNQSASSLDMKTRKEADAMLDAIVAVREKHFGQI
jgi:hypothetical protein